MAGRWLDVGEAASVLGISSDAIRKRIARGTLRSDRRDGGVRVWLDDEQDGARAGGDYVVSTDVLGAKDETILLLREQVQAERQAHAETRRLLMAALERIPPQIEPPRDAPVPSEAPGPTETPTDASAGPEKATSRPERSWWRTFFGVGG